ncbi:hypothetical protein B0J12DRAFT_701288 [Macrophomina phaseolina]|uniref:Uncharacterized protein n=1 Tax=Macrophomina phaseolina TaxID=35725 RepID=A0ABQ8G556_9PEZI|nr:hypothetical protein B0J12DRAFT_701288 [Macrophomina phaseolina]
MGKSAPRRGPWHQATGRQGDPIGKESDGQSQERAWFCQGGWTARGPGSGRARPHGTNASFLRTAVPLSPQVDLVHPTACRNLGPTRQIPNRANRFGPATLAASGSSAVSSYLFMIAARRASGTKDLWKQHVLFFAGGLLDLWLLKDVQQMKLDQSAEITGCNIARWMPERGGRQWEHPPRREPGQSARTPASRRPLQLHPPNDRANIRRNEILTPTPQHPSFHPIHVGTRGRH